MAKMDHCHATKGLTALVLRLGLAAVFLPMGIAKVFGGMYGYLGYMDAAAKITAMSQGVVPAWLGTFMGYAMPLAELYIGVALLLGFGKRFTKWVTLLVTFSLLSFWYLRDGANFAWFMNPHMWFFLASLALLFTCSLGRFSVDQMMCKECKMPNGKMNGKKK